MRFQVLLGCLFVTFSVFSQGIDHDYELIEFKPPETNRKLVMTSCMELSPDGNSVAMSTEQGGPLVIWDWKNKKVAKEYDVSGYYAGPVITYSPNGKYMLLEQQFFLDFKPNKDKPIKVEVLDLETGKIIFRKKDVNDAAFMGGGDQVAVLKGDDLKVYLLDKSSGSKDSEGDFGGKEKKKLKVEDAKNAFAVSPKGDVLAVARKITSKDIKNIATLRTDKKAQKYALKFKYVVDFYDAESLKLKYTSDDAFDIIFNMKFTRDGEDVIVFSKAHTKMEAGTQGFINLLDSKSGELKRAMFNSYAPMPDYKENSDKSFMGVVSVEGQLFSAGSINWFNYETGRTVSKFDVDLRFGEMLGSNGRTYFVFLPDGRILSSYGNKLAYIKIQ